MAMRRKYRHWQPHPALPAFPASLEVMRRSVECAERGDMSLKAGDGGAGLRSCASGLDPLSVLQGIIQGVFFQPDRCMSELESLNIPAWGSEEALRKEEHVARFLEREYKAAANKPISLEELGISAAKGPMWEETEELIETHYDEQIEFFNSFLDSSYRAYSMAYFGDDRDEVMNSALSLEEAQTKKFQLICDRIGIQGDEKILNIGCGFGSFERYILQRFPHVHGKRQSISPIAFF